MNTTIGQARIILKYDPTVSHDLGAAVPASTPFLARLLNDPDLPDPEGRALLEWTLQYLTAHPSEHSPESSAAIVSATRRHPSWVQPHQQPALFLLALG